MRKREALCPLSASHIVAALAQLLDSLLFVVYNGWIEWARWT